MCMGDDELPNRDVRVCGEHFTKEDYRTPTRGQPSSKVLKWFAVPLPFVVPGEHPVEVSYSVMQGYASLLIFTGVVLSK